MSWREMRNFCEMMRALGYQRLISIENFRCPNFLLMSEVLKWLALRFDSNADLPQSVNTEQDRVHFIKFIIHFMATKAFVKLNPRRLYKSDGYAVKEILKLVNILYSAIKVEKLAIDEEDTDLNISEILNVSKLKQLQQTRALASQLTSSGAALHSFLAREVDLREARNQAINRQLDSEWIEECLVRARDSLYEEIKQTEQALVNVASDEVMLDNKIEKRRNELERNQKRLSTLQSVRPAYMEEYEQLEEELNVYYSTYLTRFRNLAYLENLKEELAKENDSQFIECEAPIKSTNEHVRKVTDNSDSFLQQTKIDGFVKNKLQRMQKQKLKAFENKITDICPSGQEGDLGSEIEGLNNNIFEDLDEDEEEDDEEDEEDDDDDDDDDDEEEEEEEDELDNDYNVDVLKNKTAENIQKDQRKRLSGVGLSVVGNGYHESCYTGAKGAELMEKWSPDNPMVRQATVGLNKQGRRFNTMHGRTTELSAQKASSKYCNSQGETLDSNNYEDEDEPSDGDLDKALAEAIAEAGTLSHDFCKKDPTAYSNFRSRIMNNEKQFNDPVSENAGIFNDEDDF